MYPVSGRSHFALGNNDLLMQFEVNIPIQGTAPQRESDLR